MNVILIGIKGEQLNPKYIKEIPRNVHSPIYNGGRKSRESDQDGRQFGGVTESRETRENLD
jgi:hypothetical protein